MSGGDKEVDIVDSPKTLRPAARSALAAALAAVGAAWLALALHPGDALTEWLTIAVVGAPLAALVSRPLARLPERPGDVADGTLLALAAALGVALGAAADAFGTGETAGAIATAFGQGALLGLAVALPGAMLVLGLLARGASAPAAGAEAAPAPRGTTRRGFLQAGAVSSVAAAGLARVAPVGAQAPEPFRLTITEGDIEMEDGTKVFFRGFGGPSATHPTLPGPPIGNPGPGVRGREVFEDQPVRVIITNTTPRAHTFLIERTASEKPKDPIVGPVDIPAGETVDFTFTCPPAGTYIYRDADRNNRLLGMHGIMIVQPLGVGGRLLPYKQTPDRLAIPTELRGQWVWALHDVDPVLGEMARVQRERTKLDFPLSKITPRFFFINGETGVLATLNKDKTVPVVPLQSAADLVSGVLIRCVNTGIATHSLHWHGNHVFQIERNGVPQPAGMVFEKDVQCVDPLERVSVVLPAHTGYDAFPPLNDHHPKFAEQHFPMHCHAEMSQTAAGGSYPFGMLTDWHLVQDEHVARRVRSRLGDQRARALLPVPAPVLQDAIDERLGDDPMVPVKAGGGKGRGRRRKNRGKG